MSSILMMLGDTTYCDHLYRFLGGLDYTVSLASSQEAAIGLLGSRIFDVAILDNDVPGCDLRALIREIVARHPNTAIIVLHSATTPIGDILGNSIQHVFRILQKPFYDAELNFQVKRAIESNPGHGDGREAYDHDDTTNKHSEFIGQSPAIQRIFRILGRVAKTDASVIILGETGTGKELVAWTIHKDSLRAEGPFVRVNCAALPEQLLESELFGYEKGAFTGADKTKVGRFEHANGGTIFLDEVADMSLTTQAKLLRVLQQKEFERLGSNVSIKTDVRILSATNRNLMDMMRKGQFREDLFYRLNVISVRLPPLRDRGGDISLLLLYFLRRSTAKMRKQMRGFSQDALETLTRYPWPGNIREMENTLERAVLLAEGDTIGVDDLDLIFADYDGPDCKQNPESAPDIEPGVPIQDRVGPSGTVTLPPDGITLAEAERQLIEQALKRCGGSQIKAARILGISGRVLSYKIMNLRRKL